MTLYALDLMGVVVFAISGALAAGRRQFDLLGVIVLAAATAVGGGTIRDVLLDRHPIFWLADSRYLVVIIGAALATVAYARGARVPRRALDVADAFGLALFAVTGTRIAEAAGMPGLSCVLLGAVTGAAGGVVRDVLTVQVPLVLRRGTLYASAAIAGTSLYVVLVRTGVDPRLSAYAGMIVVAGLRISSIVWGLSLPVFAMRGAEDERGQ